MSDQPAEGAKPQAQTPAPQNAAQQVVDALPKPKPPAEKAEDQGTDWEKHARTWEDRARANKQQLDAMQQRWDKFTQAFAPEAPASKPEDMIQALTDRIDRSERQADIERLARRHGITEDGDIAILAAVTDATQREALAARLKSHAPVIPPDPGQGNQPSAQSNEDAEYANFYPSRK